MAEDKKGFILYADQKELFDQLPDDKAGELIKHIFKYVNDENPITEDILIKIAFTPIKQQLKRDLVKYEDKIDKKSISGREGNLKRWCLDLYNKYKEGIHTLEDAENIAKHRKVSHTDKVPSQSIANIAVNDNVNVKDNVNDKKKEKNKEFEIFWNEYHSVTNKQKEDKVPTEKYWNKLTTFEKEKALSSIKDYSKTNQDSKYLKKARTYLSDKCFNNEFTAAKAKPNYKI